MEGRKKAFSWCTFWTPRTKCIIDRVWSGGRGGDSSRWSKCGRPVGEDLGMRPGWGSWELSRSYRSMCVAVYEWCCPCLGNICVEKYKTSLVSDIQSSGPCFSVYCLFYLLHIRASKEILKFWIHPQNWCNWSRTDPTHKCFKVFLSGLESTAPQTLGWDFGVSLIQCALNTGQTDLCSSVSYRPTSHFCLPLCCFH